MVTRHTLALWALKFAWHIYLSNLRKIRNPNSLALIDSEITAITRTDRWTWLHRLR